jgi:SAM-dependent methyltransferase
MKQSLQRFKRRVARRIPRRRIRFGDLHRTTPLCQNYGFSRGKPIDRFYIEQFMAQYSPHIQGRVMEVLNANYTRKYGGDRVTTSDVLDINPLNPKATVVDDLRTLASVYDQSYDCIILTQTLHLIDDDCGALRQLYRILAPGGFLLLTVPCISHVPRTAENGIWNRFYTDHGLAYSLTKHFQPARFATATYGNLPAATAFLYGLSIQDIDPALLRLNDPTYPLIIGAVAQKSPLSP